VLVQTKGRTFKIAIARLSDADKAFIREQSAKSGGEATDSFTRITPPVSVKSLPVKDREAVLEANNNGDQAISQLAVSIALLREDFLRGRALPGVCRPNIEGRKVQSTVLLERQAISESQVSL
jgi:hypothetical protein